MHGSFRRAHRFCLFIGAALLASTGSLFGLGCAQPSSSDNGAQANQPERFRPSGEPLPSIVTQERVVLPDGPPSGVYENADYGLRFNHHSFLQRSEAAGRGFGKVTLRYGNGRIVVTTYETAVGARELITELREAIEQHYRGATFPHKMPQLVQIGESPIPQPPSYGAPMIEWSVGQPEPLPSESSYAEEDAALAYTELRRLTWNGSGETVDQFNRRESWRLETEVWERFTRSTGSQTFYGLSGMCYYNDERYIVTLEATDDTSRPVHIVYFYPYTDYPAMQQIISTFQGSLSVN